MTHDIDPDKPVRVFRNWKRGCYTIMQGGRLRASAAEVRLADVAFLVRESGRERMLRTRQRSVHAYAVGRLVDFVHPSEARRLEPVATRRVAYDPYAAACFMDTDSRAPVGAARLVDLLEGGVTYEAA